MWERETVPGEASGEETKAERCVGNRRAESPREVRDKGLQDDGRATKPASDQETRGEK